jgi:hypothetical protein
MPRATIGILALGAAVVAGCGGGAHFANEGRPATPLDLTVYVSNSRVLVSPNSVGAGPVIFIITNQASQAESLSIQPSSGGSAVATTAPINPQATSQVQVNFCSSGHGCAGPGSYTVTTGDGGSTDASNSTPPGIQPATLHVGQGRPNSNNVLLQP